MYLLFDIGGTKMRFATSADRQSFGEPVIVDTSQQFSEGLKQIGQIVERLKIGQTITAAAGGIAGPFNRERAELVGAPHLPDWVGKPVKQELEKIIGGPVFLENDTALVGLGEAAFGSGLGHEIVAYITVSTGVGGVRIVREAIDIHVNDFEPGHQVINFADYGIEPCSCGGFGHLESYISGTDFVRRFGKHPEEVPAGSEIWDIHARILAYGLNNIIVHWAPDIIVLGGAMMKIPGIPLDGVRRHLKEIVTIFPELPLVDKARLGDVGGLYGAMAFLRHRLDTV